MKKIKFLFVISVCLNVCFLFKIYLTDNSKISILKLKKKEKVNLIGYNDKIDELKKLKGAIELFNLPKNGCVPNNISAIKIAEIVWGNIYGSKIYQDAPFNTVLINDSIWVVSGTIDKNKSGGSFYIKMLKKNGEILNVTREK